MSEGNTHGPAHTYAGDTLISDRIRLAMPGLSPSLRRVAQAVLSEPTTVVISSAVQLAARIGVSQPTVTRFAKAIDLPSYHALQLLLAQEAGRAAASGQDLTGLDELGPDADIEGVIAVMTTLDTASMELAARSLNRTALEAAAKLVADARSVDVYGVGASGVLAQEVELRLFRLGVPIRAWIDVHGATTSAALRSKEDVAIAISGSGRTRETYEALATAKSRHAATIALTGDATSPLALTADVHLTTLGTETGFRTGSFAMRHAQLLVLDVLFTRVARLAHDRSVRAIEATSHIPTAHEVRSTDRLIFDNNPKEYP